MVRALPVRSEIEQSCKEELVNSAYFPLSIRFSSWRSTTPTVNVAKIAVKILGLVTSFSASSAEARNICLDPRRRSRIKMFGLEAESKPKCWPRN